MAYMILQTSLPDNGYAELEGPNITYWPNGESAQQMPIDEFMVKYPRMGRHLIDNNLVRKGKPS